MVNFNAFRISSSGMSAERIRLDVVAANIANADSTRALDGGGPYRRKIVQFQEVQAEAIGEAGAKAKIPQKYLKPVSGVRVTGVIDDQSPFRMVYDPDHPDANAEGYVSYPNVNIVTEMTDMIAASRAYEANATAFNAAKSMYQKALEIGS